MAINLPSGDGRDEVVSAINTTPLVDVMLVLLIIFLITIPVVNSVPVQLPKERSEHRETKPNDIVISVDDRGRVYWLESRISRDALAVRLRHVAAMNPQPEVQIRGDLHANYDPVGQVIFECQRAGIGRIAFITEPPANG
ncbi:ExbD/TolR family protein [Burkholderia anthina]|uniref:ExbD/TolR family protein n=1 Tax=Burkholderia anthina TaxID=179879 RepID=UPI00158B4F24|nr:biopolymer transporter ExbD [Burkholderia anthina]